jgi:hypothetical protein
LEVSIKYYTRKANKYLAFYTTELKEQLLGDLKKAGVYDRGQEEISHELVMEKRASFIAWVT